MPKRCRRKRQAGTKPTFVERRTSTPKPHAMSAPRCAAQRARRPPDGTAYRRYATTRKTAAAAKTVPPGTTPSRREEHSITRRNGPRRTVAVRHRQRIRAAAANTVCSRAGTTADAARLEPKRRRTESAYRRFRRAGAYGGTHDPNRVQQSPSGLHAVEQTDPAAVRCQSAGNHDRERSRAHREQQRDRYGEQLRARGGNTAGNSTRQPARGDPAGSQGGTTERETRQRETPDRQIRRPPRERRQRGLVERDPRSSTVKSRSTKPAPRTPGSDVRTTSLMHPQQGEDTAREAARADTKGTPKARAADEETELTERADHAPRARQRATAFENRDPIQRTHQDHLARGRSRRAEAPTTPTAERGRKGDQYRQQHPAPGRRPKVEHFRTTPER